jgi:endonuclease G, mitochondrial
VLTANHTIGQILGPAITPVAMKPDHRLYFSTAIEPRQSEGMRVVEVVGVDAVARLALLRLERPMPGSVPLPIAPVGFQIVPRSEIYLVGYPYYSSLTDAGLIQHVFSGKVGLKRLQPGMILAAPDTERSFDHDASTLAGNAGSPVIDLASGRVIGVHWGGMEEAGQKRGRAAALTMSGNRTLLSALP